jgi:hypothetical protein
LDGKAGTLREEASCAEQTVWFVPPLINLQSTIAAAWERGKAEGFKPQAVDFPSPSPPHSNQLIVTPEFYTETCSATLVTTNCRPRVKIWA